MSRLLEYVPLYYRQSGVMRSLLSSEIAEADLIHANLANLRSQLLLETATDLGLSRWELILGLPNYTGRPLQQRRERIVSKLRGMGTVTAGLIRNVAESYVYGSVLITELPRQNIMQIKFVDERGVPLNLNDLKDAIERIKPAHMAVTYVFTYTTWAEIAGAFTWGSLTSLTWGQLTTLEV